MVAAQTSTKTQVRLENVNIINCFTTRKSHESDVSGRRLMGNLQRAYENEAQNIYVKIL